MRYRGKFVTNALMAGALVLGSGAAFADAADRLYHDEIADEAGEISAEDVSDDKLHRFIDAAHEVQAIRSSYAEKIADASEEDRSALQAEAVEEMAKAVEDHGLEVSEYREIGHLLESDGELRDRLEPESA